MTLFDEMTAAAAAFYGKTPILVPGEGARHARVLLIGEAPGGEEEKQRRPFVGKAGKNLDSFLELAGIDRAELYVTNVVKLRPTAISAAGRTVNRTPNAAEIALFTPFLRREIEQVDPMLLVTLGNTPLRALCGKSVTIGAVHGTLLPCGTRRLYPMYHPASVIYNRALLQTARDDTLRLKTLLTENA